MVAVPFVSSRRLSYNDYDNDYTNSNVSSRLCSLRGADLASTAKNNSLNGCQYPILVETAPN